MSHVRLFRKMRQWEWYEDSHMVHMFVHLLISAAWRPEKVKGVDIKPGQLITTLPKLSVETGLSVQQVRRCLAKLSDGNGRDAEIATTTTNKFRIITLLNYSKYQIVPEGGQQAINRQGNRPATDNGLEGADIATEKDPPRSKEEKKTNREPSQVPPCPHGQIVDLFNELLPELPRVREWGQQNKKNLRTRWREKKERQDLDWWRGYFDLVRQCPFLMGQVDGSNFLASLDWLVKPSNMTKVINGNYLPKGAHKRRGATCKQCEMFADPVAKCSKTEPCKFFKEIRN